jgi:hypothetical protein
MIKINLDPTGAALTIPSLSKHTRYNNQHPLTSRARLPK